jgi:8-oxo-dGTP pyrophosphatase MutT (NUDIX family)
MIGDASAFSAYALGVKLFEALPVGIRRICYRVAHRLLRVYWFVVRPTTDGAKCLLTNGDQVLLVRHTYGEGEWDLPGGTIRRGEPPADAARREMHEELGVMIDDWTSLGRIDGRVHHHPNRLHCFHAELDHDTLVFDHGEIAAGCWFPRDRLPAGTGAYARQIIGLLHS